MTTPPATHVVAAALGLGILGDHLIRAPVWGLNVALSAILFAIHGITLAWDARTSPATAHASPWPWFAAAFFSGFWAVRDESLLMAVDLVAALALLSLPLVQARGVALRAAGALVTLTAPLMALRDTAVGAVAAWRALPPAGPRRPLLIGAALAAPLILLFTAIFSSADPIFAAAVSSLAISPGLVLSHAVVIALLTTVCSGYFRALTTTATGPAAGLAAVRLALPVFVPLGATAVVFAAFLAVQAGSLFGGEAFVAATTGLTFAEYARRGFFQLVFAAALTLPLVYVAPFLAGQLTPGRQAALRILLQAQLGLTGLVLLSALWRMGLYISAYGLTEDRLYGTAVMVWIAATLVVFSRTVIRDRPRGAAFGSLVAAVAALAVLNLANPPGLIARYNVTRSGGVPDFEHLTRLGGDAVPPLVAHLDLVPPDQRCQVVRTLKDRYATPRGDWRGWNLARSRARRAAEALDLPPGCPRTLDAPDPSA